MPAAGNYYGAPNCEAPREPTLPEEFRTWNLGDVSAVGDFTRYHPWRSPGAAPVADACGVAGGYATPQGGGGETPPPEAVRQLRRHTVAASRPRGLENPPHEWRAVRAYPET